jgi:putative restriction endonuclease
VRNTAVTEWVKELYDFTCQVCGTRLETPVGPYAEAAHIRAVGRPHIGPDATENVLCLCPNDHVLFDRGFLSIADDGRVLEVATGRPVGQLAVKGGHNVDPAHLAYRRTLFGP